MEESDTILTHDRKSNDDNDPVVVENRQHGPDRQRCWPTMSSETLLYHIARWENLLRCTKCERVQESLENLWVPCSNASIQQRCTSCLDPQFADDHQHEIKLSTAEEKCEEWGPLSKAIHCEGLSSEQSAREPALLLQRLKHLLCLLNDPNCASKSPRCAHRIVDRSEMLPHGQQNNNDENNIENIQTLSTKLHLPVPSSGHNGKASYYASLDPNFFPNLPSNNISSNPREHNKKGFRYRKFGGEVYDPIHRNRRSRNHQTPIQSMDETTINPSVQILSKRNQDGKDGGCDSAFEFPEAQSEPEKDSSGCQQNRHDVRNISYGLLSTDEGYALQQGHSHCNSTSLGSLHDVTETVTGNQLSKSLSTLIRQNSSGHSDLLGMVGKDQQPVRKSTRNSIPINSQRSSASIDTQDLPQTADFGEVNHDCSITSTSKVIRPTVLMGLNEPLHITGNENLGSPIFSRTIRPTLDDSEIKNVLRHAMTKTSSKQLHFGSNVDSQISIATGALPETADFESFSFEKSRCIRPKPLHIIDSTSPPNAVDPQTKTYIHRVTPPSIARSDRLAPAGLPVFVTHETLSSHDNMLLRSLNQNWGFHVIEVPDDSCAAFTATDLESSGRHGALVCNAEFLKTERNPFAIHGENFISVCLQSFPYLVARTCGWSLLSSECLGAIQRGLTDLEEYSVWGDAQLYATVSNCRFRVPWHENATWWESPNLSPSQSSKRRWMTEAKRLLSRYQILVAKQSITEEDRRNINDCELLSSFVHSKIDIFHNAETSFNNLTGNQVESLCALAGAKIISSYSSQKDSEGRNDSLVLVPDTLDDEAAFVHQLGEKGRIPMDWIELIEKERNIHFVYYSWIVDSICADTIAPLCDYEIDFFQMSPNKPTSPHGILTRPCSAPMNLLE